MAGPFHVDSTYGSDANSGLSALLPKATLAAAIALFDASSTEILYVNGTFRNEVIALTSKSNKTITKLTATDPASGLNWVLPSGSSVRQAVLRGDVLISGTWTVDGTDSAVWHKTIPKGLTLSAVTYGWDTHTLSAIGQHAWAMVASTSLATVRTYSNNGAGGAKGVYFYNSGTGDLACYFGADNPNSSGHAVSYCTSEATLAAIRLVTCTACTVSDINFALWPVYAGQFGWGVRLEGSASCLVTGCTFDDMGRHIAGTIGGSGNSSGNTISGCTFRAMTPTDAPIVFNGLDAEGALSNDAVGNTIYLTRWLGIDGAYAHGQLGAVAALAANTQTGVYAHADSGNAAISKIRVSGGSIINVEKVGNTKAVAGDNAVVTSAANRRTKSAFPLQVVGVTITDFSAENMSNTTAAIFYDQCVISTTCAAATGFGAAGILGQCNVADTTDRLRTFQNCTIVADLSGAITRAFSGQLSTGGTKRFSFINCSFYNSTGTLNNHAWFDATSEAVQYFETVGCSFAHPNVTQTNPSRFMLFDSDAASDPSGSHLDNRYFNHAEYSHQRAFGTTAAAWITNVDTAAVAGVNMLATLQYSSVTTLALTTSEQQVRRTTTTTIPSSAGINGVRYSGNFGAWQYLAASSVTDRNMGREPGSERLSRVAR